MSAQTLCGILALCFSFALAPFLPGVINRVKARMGGRTGRPLLQLYFDLRKLLGKRPVYSATTSSIFLLAPGVLLASTVAAALVLPFGTLPALFFFPGDPLFFAALLGLGRFSLILGALDTGSAFEGMGAAREAFFGALAEPLLVFCLILFGYAAGEYSLSALLGGIAPTVWAQSWPFFILLCASFFLLLLVENCRIPADDPNTHLELTMIHEVMVLDHSGPDLAFVEYASALKLWLFGLLIAGVLVPGPATPPFTPAGALVAGALPGLLWNLFWTGICLLGTAVLVGLVESLMARLRMERVPQILTMAGAFTFLAALVMWR